MQCNLNTHKIKLQMCNMMTATNKMIFELLLATLLFTVIPVSPVEAASPIRCEKWRGEYRDCLCDTMTRDTELHCHDDKTYYERVIKQETRKCPFKCANGGVFEKRINMCHCPPGFSGLCCQKGIQIIL